MVSRSISLNKYRELHVRETYTIIIACARMRMCYVQEHEFYKIAHIARRDRACTLFALNNYRGLLAIRENSEN